MPSYRDLWPDKWLKAEHLQGRRPTVAVETVVVERLHSPQTRKAEPRLVASFYGKSLRLILNKTQAQALAAITGTEDYTAWPGHQVVLSAGIAPNGKGTITISPVPDPPTAKASNGHNPAARLTQPPAQAEPATETHPAPFPEDEDEPAGARRAWIDDPGAAEEIPA